MKYLWLLIFPAVVLSACLSVPALQSRLDYANHIASEQHWHRISLPTKDFMMAAYVPDNPVMSGVLNIYIEGDGLAWVTRSLPSKNPTPGQPVALELAIRHPGTDAAYLARPCQYIEINTKDRCNQSLWTARRFSPVVISATDDAIDQLKESFKAKKIRLIGYSGGGAVAVLAAARRNDVIQIITIAGNLDHKAWTSKLAIDPLYGSLNPADYWKPVAQIPQVHYVGGRDHIVPVDIARSYQSRFPAAQKPTIRIVPDYDHNCCWPERWPDIFLDETRPGTGDL